MASSDNRAFDELAALPSLGQTSARMLIDAGVADVEDLRRLGPIECYRRLRFFHGKRVTINFVYAMECAIHGLDWRLLSGERKAELKAEARAVGAQLADAPPSRRVARARRDAGP